VCGFAVSRYEEIRQKAIAAGTWRPFVDPGPVWAHLAELRGAGIGYRQVAATAGVSRTTVAELMNTGRGLHRGVRPEVATAILTVTRERILERKTERALAGGTSDRIDATGSRRRIQALVAIGWPMRELAERIGVTPANLAAVLRRPAVTGHTAKLVADLYDQLSMTVPADGEATHRARLRAARNGWQPPLAWDDESIDDPGDRRE
jgi:lambda repressor-like predicted transcriptional regulator